MKTEYLDVDGMHCGSCVTRVRKALTEIPGVSEVDVALSTGKVNVMYDQALATPALLASAIERAGYRVGAIAVDVGSSPKGCSC